MLKTTMWELSAAIDLRSLRPGGIDSGQSSLSYEHSNSQKCNCPILFAGLAEMCEGYQEDAGDISKSASASAMSLSKIVVRPYAQTENATVQSRCLSIIDEMERQARKAASILLTARQARRFTNSADLRAHHLSASPVRPASSASTCQCLGCGR